MIQRAAPPRGEARTDFEIAGGLRDALAERGQIDFDLLPWKSHRDFIDYQLLDPAGAAPACLRRRWHDHHTVL